MPLSVLYRFNDFFFTEIKYSMIKIHKKYDLNSVMATVKKFNMAGARFFFYQQGKIERKKELFLALVVYC